MAIEGPKIASRRGISLLKRCRLRLRAGLSACRSGGRVYVSARVAPIDLVPNAGENAMQHSRLCLSFIVTVAMIGAVERNFVFAQTEAPSQTPVPATPGPQPPSAAVGRTSLFRLPFRKLRVIRASMLFAKSSLKSRKRGTAPHLPSGSQPTSSGSLKRQILRTSSAPPSKTLRRP